MYIIKELFFFFRSYREYIDAQRGMSRSHYASDDEESARIISSSAPLSVLLIPSLKEVKKRIYLILVFPTVLGSLQ